jgi:hypothetical protein
MLANGYVYVPADSEGNLDIGVENGVWGWRASALDRAGARAELQSLRTGDFVFLGHRGPNSRVKPGGWTDAVLGRVVFAAVTRPYHISDEPMWPTPKDEPGELYRERIGLDVLDDRASVPGARLGRDAMERLRLSANKQGVAVIGRDRDAMAALAITVAAAGEDDRDVADPDGSGDHLGHTGATDAIASVLVRKEQAKLRKLMIGAAATVRCAMCGRVLPPDFVHVAHVKRRSVASHAERNNLRNAMLACVAGCDALFEHGYVYVDDDGIIRASARAGSSTDVRALAAALENRRCTAFDAKSQEFFAWHRTHVALS